ncbi:acetoacetate decarboxylase family protein [Streptomyces sp. NRRL B-1347]|uniref:acetoacetate decarboxylase family protein n=1 Tax=Streptomyces sp. NRRL B-1347 TaxID=1476877 RepID=UPI000691FD7B|nr:acetoacetate decarboxylase family protein [Streptomyces sp. NRRL B-1347]
MRFDPDYTYRMPVAFGPMPGPRQALPGCAPKGGEASLTSYALRFTTTAEAVGALLPPRFALDGEPVVTVEYTELTDVPWLAGRGYDTFAVKLPVRFEGREDQVTGSFVAVVWENMADPIITGREELGYAKLFADLTSRPTGRDAHRCTASWDGHTFAELEFERITEVRPEPAAPSDGVLNFGYVPGVNAGSEPDRMGAVLTPAVDGVDTIGQATAVGRVRFVRSSWEQLPTFYNVVNALERLPVLSQGECVVRRLRRNIENRGQRRLV